MVRTLYLLSFACILSLGPGCQTNPITGRSELMLLSEEQDVEIGKSYAPEIEKQMKGKIPDEALQSYVNQVGQAVARVSHRPDIEYHFTAVQHESVNALALPGGYIFITRGMLESLRTEAQLAGILAHEIVHVVARDVANAMSRQIGIEALLSAVGSAESAKNLATVAELGTQIISLRFSRTDERDADIGGTDYMVAAGYNPYGMVQSMQMLVDQGGERPIEFLSTHPSPENRIEYLQQYIQSRTFNIAGLKVGAERYKASVLDRLRN